MKYEDLEVGGPNPNLEPHPLLDPLIVRAWAAIAAHKSEICTWSALVGGSIAVTGLLTLGGYLVTCYHTEGKITSTAWYHTETRERFLLSKAEGWEHQISRRLPVMPVNGRGEDPGAFDVRGCYSRWHHDEEYACGRRRVCSTDDDGDQDCTWRTKYCSRPVYRDWCTYSTFRWVPVGKVTFRGGNPGRDVVSLPWPHAVAGPRDRIVRTEKYHVEFVYEKDDDTGNFKAYGYYDPKTEYDLLSWHAGDAADVTVRRIGYVVRVEHPKTPAKTPAKTNSGKP